MIPLFRDDVRGRRRGVRLMALLAAGSLVAAACGGHDGGGATDTGAPDTTAPAEPDTDEPATTDPDTDDPATTEPATPDPNAEGRYGGTLTVGQAILTDSLDFVNATALQHEIVLDGIYESLLEVTMDLEYVPHLATEVEEVSETEYLFTIREDVIFHDGTPMTVDDVVFTFERILAEEYGGPSKQRLALLESVTAVDDNTVRFELSGPQASFLYHMASPETTGIHSRAFAAANDDDLSRVANGTGAFKLRSFTPNERIELERHDQYWQEGLPYLDEVLIPIITDESTRLAGLRTGELDLTSISPQSLPDLEAIDEIMIGEVFASSSQVIFMNCEREPLSILEARQALFLSIDEQLIMDILYEPGIASPTRFAPPIAPGFGFTGEGSDLAFWGVDTDRARELLAEAGYPDGFEISIGFLNTGAFENNRRIIELIRETAAPAGITVNVFPMERGQMIEGEWDGWSTPLPGKPDPAAQERWLRAENALIRCPDPALTELLDIQNTKVNVDERLEAWDDVENFIEENAILHNTLAQPGRVHAWRDDVVNYQPLPHDRRFLLRQTWLERD